MAGRGPTPKEPAQRRRRNKDPNPVRKVTVEAVSQPALPTFFVADHEGKRRKFVWHARTRAWWKMWGASPLATEFTAADWDFLLDTAVLHSLYWRGDVKVAPELRLRVAKFGTTPEDRQRLRIQFVPPPSSPSGPGTVTDIASRRKRLSE